MADFCLRTLNSVKHVRLILVPEAYPCQRRGVWSAGQVPGAFPMRPLALGGFDCKAIGPRRSAFLACPRNATLNGASRLLLPL